MQQLKSEPPPNKIKPALSQLNQISKPAKPERTSAWDIEQVRAALAAKV